MSFKPYKTYDLFTPVKRKTKIRHRTKLYYILREKGLSSIDLAVLTGLTKQAVSRYVKGHNKDILLNTAKRICNALEITLDELFS